MGNEIKFKEKFILSLFFNILTPLNPLTTYVSLRRGYEISYNQSSFELILESVFTDGILTQSRTEMTLLFTTFWEKSVSNKHQKDPVKLYRDLNTSKINLQ